MRLGAPVWPFKWEPPYEDALRRIAGLGFRAVELNAWNGDILANYYTPGTIKNIRAILDGEGLVLSQFVSCQGDDLPAQMRRSGPQPFLISSATLILEWRSEPR